MSSFFHLKEIKTNSRFNDFSIILLSIFLYGISLGINSETFGSYFEVLNITKEQINQVFFMSLLGSLIIAPFLLYLCSIFGMHNFIHLSFGLRSVAIILIAYATNAETLSILMLIFGAFGFSVYILLFQWVILLADSNHRAKYIALATCAYSLGVFCGPKIIGLIYDDEYNLRLITSAIVSYLAIVPMSGISAEQPNYKEYHKINFVHLLKVSRIAIICAVASDYIYFSINEYLPLYAMGHGYLQNNAYNLLHYFTLTGIFTAIPIGILIDKYGKFRILIALSIIVAASIQLLNIAINYTIPIMLVCLLLSSSLIGIIIAVFAIIAKKFTGPALLISNSMVHAVGAVSSYAGVYTTGIAINLVGDKGLIFSVSSLFLIFFATLLYEAQFGSKNSA